MRSGLTTAHKPRGEKQKCNSAQQTLERRNTPRWLHALVRHQLKEQNMKNDNEIMRALINQVMKAAHGKPETEVVTFITKPMWRAFCRATGLPRNSSPTEWQGIKKTIRVFGSHTIIVPGKKLASVSFCAHVEKQTTAKRS